MKLARAACGALLFTASQAIASPTTGDTVSCSASGTASFSGVMACNAPQAVVSDGTEFTVNAINYFSNTPVFGIDVGQNSVTLGLGNPGPYNEVANFDTTISLQDSTSRFSPIGSVNVSGDVSGFNAANYSVDQNGVFNLNTSGLGIRDSGHIVFNFLPPSVSDLISGAVSIYTHGSQIIGSFRPNLGYTLTQAAHSLGYAAFDWVQHITGSDSPLVAVGPDPGPNGPPGFPDQHAYPFLWDIHNSSSPVGFNLDYNISADGTTLGYYDAPTNPCFSIIGAALVTACGGYVDGWTYFTTDLVGVNYDGSVGASLYEFNWKSNFGGLTGGAVYSTPSGFDPGPGTGGAVLLSQRLIFGSVPEPSTWALMLLGFGAIGFSIRRQGRRAVFA